MAGDVPLPPFKAFLAQVGKLGLSLSPMGAHNLHRFQSRLDGAGPLLTAAGDHDQGRMGAIPSSAGDRLQMGLAAPSPARAPTQMGLAASPPPRVSTQVGVAALPSARGSMQMGISTPSPAQVLMQIVWAATSLYQDVLPAQRVAGKAIASGVDTGSNVGLETLLEPGDHALCDDTMYDQLGEFSDCWMGIMLLRMFLIKGLLLRWRQSTVVALQITVFVEHAVASFGRTVSRQQFTTTTTWST